MAKIFLFLGSVFGFLSVAFGAFGAHALAEKLEPRLLEIFKTGVQYQFFHALALLAVGLAYSSSIGIQPAWLRAAGWCFVFGVFIFSGSLYILALSGVRTWGAVTPIGGLLFLVGWACLCVSILKNQSGVSS